MMAAFKEGKARIHIKYKASVGKLTLINTRYQTEAKHLSYNIFLSYFSSATDSTCSKFQYFRMRQSYLGFHYFHLKFSTTHYLPICQEDLLD